jgi:hypothetical protein
MHGVLVRSARWGPAVIALEAAPAACPPGAPGQGPAATGADRR